MINTTVLVISKAIVVALQVLVGKVLEQGLMEVLEEEELAAMRAHQEHFEQIRNSELVATQRMEAAEKRKLEEKERRLAQEKERVARERVVREKVSRFYPRPVLEEEEVHLQPL